MNGAGGVTPRRGLGVVLVVGFGALLIFALVSPGLPITVPILASAGILSGLAMSVRSRWAHVIDACAAALIGVVFLAAGILRLLATPDGILSSLLMTALGAGCCVAAVLRVRAHRRLGLTRQRPDDE